VPDLAGAAGGQGTGWHTTQGRHSPAPGSAEAIDAALKEIEAAGMLFVVASGNQGTDLDARPAFPASSG
jgi:hypothetical protein